MVEAPFTATAVNTSRAAVEGDVELADGSRLVWGLSRREFGPMSFHKGPEWDIAANRQDFLRLFNLKLDQLIAPRLNHTPNVQVVGADDRRKGAREWATGYEDTDGLLTRDANTILMTTHADCLPVWLVEPESGWIGMAHVGWRGLLAGIVENLVNQLPKEHRGRVKLAAGPGICVNHYEVGDEVAERFLQKAHFTSTVSNAYEKPHLDMLAGVQAEADRLGVALDRSGFACTFEEDYLSSYRREGQVFWPMAAFIVRLGGR